MSIRRTGLVSLIATSTSLILTFSCRTRAIEPTFLAGSEDAAWKSLKSLADLENRLNQFGSLEHLLTALDPEVRSHTMLGVSGLCTQGSSWVNPQVVHFSARGDFVISYLLREKNVFGKLARGFEHINVIQYAHPGDTSQVFAFRQVVVAKDGKSLELKQPTTCGACHGEKARPLFQPYPLSLGWVGGIHADAYGGPHFPAYQQIASYEEEQLKELAEDLSAELSDAKVDKGVRSRMAARVLGVRDLFLRNTLSPVKRHQLSVFLNERRRDIMLFNNHLHLNLFRRMTSLYEGIDQKIIAAVLDEDLGEKILNYDLARDPQKRHDAIPAAERTAMSEYFTFLLLTFESLYLRPSDQRARALDALFPPFEFELVTSHLLFRDFLKGAVGASGVDSTQSSAFMFDKTQYLDRLNNNAFGHALYPGQTMNKSDIFDYFKKSRFILTENVSLIGIPWAFGANWRSGFFMQAHENVRGVKQVPLLKILLDALGTPHGVRGDQPGFESGVDPGAY